jgi:hypothetical protein
MNVFDRLYEQVILEFSEGATKKIIQKFSNEASEQDIRRELDDFEKYKNSLQKKDPFQYKSWIEFTEAIHAAKGKAEFKKKKIPDESQITSTDDIIADDENVTIYKGDSQDKCVMYGKGYTFCISRQAGGNMFSSYRLGKESTFYFIYFKKKAKTENDHIMVLDHTNSGYEWTFANNDTETIGGGWNEIVSKYPELKKYERLLINKKLDDTEKLFLQKLENFTNTPTLEEFSKLSYKEKVQALKSVVDLPDDIWKTLDSTLRNEFLSIGPNLTDHQANDLKPNEIERYKKMRNISFPQLVDEEFWIYNKHDNIENIRNKPIAYALIIYDMIYNGKQPPEEYFKQYLSSESDMEYFSDTSHHTVSIFKSMVDADMQMPDILLDTLKRNDYFIVRKNFKDSFYYADHYLKWKDVPHQILQTIEKSPFSQLIPPNVTIQENKKISTFNRLYEQVSKRIT